jgi:CRP-like cAMP-binding protein
LYEADDPIDRVYFPHDAVIARVAAFEDGESIVTAVIGREAVFGFGVSLDLPRALNRTVVLLSGTAARIAAADFQAACLRSPALRKVAARCTALLINQLHQSAACNAHHSLEGRLSRWLLECSDRVGSEVQLTQSMLAQMLGVRRTSVTLIACSLQSSGAIKYSRGTIRILDRLALEASACECYRTVRQRADSLASNYAHAS